MPNIHTFVNIDELPNQLNNKYGPTLTLPANEYLVTSVFTGSLTTGTPRAYAVTKGKVFVVESETSGLCNLILKPFENGLNSKIPIKFFIYRGIKLTNYLVDPDNDITIVPKTVSGIGEFIEKMYEDWEDEVHDLPKENLIIDIDGTTIKNTDYIEKIFEIQSIDYTFPIVSAGDYLGAFDKTKNYGFEIILDQLGYEPTLAEAVLGKNIITINTNDPPLTQMLNREKILNHLDPAVFYAMQSKIVKHDFSTSVDVASEISGSSIYLEFITKFESQNTVYIDIRNEHLHSFNFYDNYRNSSDTYAKIKLCEGDGNTPVLTDYEKNSWPIIIKDFTSANNNTANLKLIFKLPLKDNLFPVIFSNFSKIVTPDDVNPKFLRLNRDDTEWALTEDLVIESPNASSETSLCSLILFQYGRIYDDSYISKKVSSFSIIPQVDRVMQPRTIYDDLCSPFSIKDTWKDDTSSVTAPSLINGKYPINWKVISGERHKGWTNFPDSYITINQGVANDGIGEIAFLMINKMESADVRTPNHFSVTTNASFPISGSMHEQLSDKISFYEAYYKIEEKFLNIESTINNEDNEVKPFEFEKVEVDILIGSTTTQKSLFNFITPSELLTGEKQTNIMSFAYTFSEKGTIAGLIASNFNSGFPVYFIAYENMTIEPIIESDSYNYFTLGLHGVNNSGVITKISTGITLYSIDELHYCSLNYFNALDIYLQ